MDLHLADVRPKDRMCLSIAAFMLDTQWHSERAIRGRSSGAGFEAPATIPDPPNLERPVASAHKGPGCVSLRYTHTLSVSWLTWLPRDLVARWNVKHWNKLFQAL